MIQKPSRVPKDEQQIICKLHHHQPNVDQDIIGFWWTKCSHRGMFIQVKKNKHIDSLNFNIEYGLWKLFLRFSKYDLILKNQNWWLCNLHCKIVQRSMDHKGLEKGRRLGFSKQTSKSKTLYKVSITLQTQMISSTFLDSLWTPKSWNVNNRILLLLLLIMSLQYISLICLVGDDDDDIQQILQEEAVGHDNMMIINHAKEKLAKCVFHTHETQNTCSNWLPWKWVSRMHSHHHHGVSVCVYVCTSYNCP